MATRPSIQSAMVIGEDPILAAESLGPKSAPMKSRRNPERPRQMDRIGVEKLIDQVPISHS